MDRTYLREGCNALTCHNLFMPMLCASPAITEPHAATRRAEVKRPKPLIDLMAFFGSPAPRTCGVHSGQRRIEVSEVDQIAMLVESIETILPNAAGCSVILALENQDKDSYWVHPELAQRLRVFCRIVKAIDSSRFSVNHDPSIGLLAGEDPLEVLESGKASRRAHACQRSQPEVVGARGQHRVCGDLAPWRGKRQPPTTRRTSARSARSDSTAGSATKMG